MNKQLPPGLWEKLNDAEKEYFNDLFADARTLEWLLEQLARFGANRESIEASRVEDKV